MRVYLPATLDLLREYAGAALVPADVERFVPVDEDEESEYAALEEAAGAAAALLDGPGRRVVLVAEVSDADAAVPMLDVVAVHADTEDVEPTASDQPELGWFATQEIADLLG